MKKFRKAIIAIASLAVVAVIFGGCTVKETKYVPQTTSAPQTTERTVPTTSGRQPETMTPGVAIASAQEQAPTLYIYTDSEMLQLMSVACDSLGQWGGDYYGFLQNAQNQMANESTVSQKETSAIIIAAVFSICTQHQLGLLDAMNSMNGTTS